MAATAGERENRHKYGRLGGDILQLSETSLDAARIYLLKVELKIGRSTTACDNALREETAVMIETCCAKCAAARFVFITLQYQAHIPGIK